MKEDRVVEGAFQLALYALILFLYWLIQNYITCYIVNFYKKCKSTVSCTHRTFRIELTELDNFVRCKFNDCCWEKKILIYGQRKIIYIWSYWRKEQRLNLILSPSPSPLAESSNTRRRLSGNTSDTNSSVTSFKINFSPQACFKNEEAILLSLGTQFCGPGHFCNVTNFVNTSNLTNATATMSIQRRSLREPILSPSDGGMNGNTGGWMPRRRLSKFNNYK